MYRNSSLSTSTPQGMGGSTHFKNLVRSCKKNPCLHRKLIFANTQYLWVGGNSNRNSSVWKCKKCPAPQIKLIFFKDLHQENCKVGINSLSFLFFWNCIKYPDLHRKPDWHKKQFSEHIRLGTFVAQNIHEHCTFCTPTKQYMWV